MTGTDNNPLSPPHLQTKVAELLLKLVKTLSSSKSSPSDANPTSPFSLIFFLILVPLALLYCFLFYFILSHSLLRA